MSKGEPPRETGRARSTGLSALVVVSAALLGILGYQSVAVPSSSATSPVVTAPAEPSSAPALPASSPAAANPPAHRPHESLSGDPPRALGEADGAVPEGVTVFDGRYPAVANLDGVLLDAVRRAATDAKHDRVTLLVDSGWRSPAYQEQLLEQAISKYGSRQEAAKWVAAPTRSAHVSGNAIDIGPSAATAWLSKHGAAYGLCRIYRNEPWHYELRPAAVEHGCPPMYADPTHDPRMQP